MSDIRKLLQRIDELDLPSRPDQQQPIDPSMQAPPDSMAMGPVEAPSLDQQHSKEGYRLLGSHDVAWYVCDDDAKRRYQGNALRTDKGIVRVTSVQPVDGTSHNCHFCGAMLQPREQQSPDMSNQQNLQSMGMGDMAGGGGGMPGGGLF